MVSEDEDGFEEQNKKFLKLLNDVDQNKNHSNASSWEIESWLDSSISSTFYHPTVDIKNVCFEWLSSILWGE